MKRLVAEDNDRAPVGRDEFVRCDCGFRILSLAASSEGNDGNGRQPEDGELHAFG